MKSISFIFKFASFKQKSIEFLGKPEKCFMRVKRSSSTAAINLFFFFLQADVSA